MTLAIFDRLVLAADRSPLDGATVEIRRESDNALASTYSDRAGTTPTSPVGTLTSDSGGRATCYMPGGAYKVTVSKDAFSEVFRYVAHGTAGEQDYTDDPEYLSVRFAPTAETPDAENGATYYPTSASQLGESNSSWVGEGPYTRVPVTAQGESPAVSTWKALANTGLWPAFEKTANTSITQFDGGRVLTMNSATPTTVTFPAGILRDDQVATLAGSAPSMHMWIANRGTANVAVAVGSGVTMKSPAAFATILPSRLALCVYVRTGSGTANLYILAGGEATNIAYDNAGSGLAAVNMQAAIDELATYVAQRKTAAEWAGDSTVWLEGQLLYETDTGRAKVGDGTNTYSNIELYLGGDDDADVSLEWYEPATITSDAALDDANTAFSLDGGTMRPGTILNVSGASSPVTLTPIQNIRRGMTWMVNVLDLTYPVTLARPGFSFTRTGDLTESSPIVANVLDFTYIADGQSVTAEGGIAESTTVADDDYSSDEIELSLPATQTIENAELTFDAGQQGTINAVADDFSLPLGLSIITAVNVGFGVEFIVKSVVNVIEYITRSGASETVDASYLGRHNQFTNTGAKTLTFSDSFAPLPGVWFSGEVVAASGALTLVEDGLTLRKKSAQTLVLDGQYSEFLARYQADGNWKIVGDLAAT